MTSYKQLYFDEKNKYNEIVDDIKRLQAEFENFKKRNDKQNQQIIEHSNAALLKDFLVFMDDMEQSIKNLDNCNIDDLKKGFQMLHKKMEKFLEHYNVKPINALGQLFDPHIHEVVLKKEGEPDKVLEEIQKGYMFKDRILRHSKVAIGGKNE